MREIKALIWKEWRRCRWVIVLILATAGMMHLFFYYHPNEEYPRVYSFLHKLLFEAVGLILGAAPFSSEYESQGIEFLQTQPLSKGKIWAAKVFSSLGMLLILSVGSILVFQWVSIRRTDGSLSSLPAGLANMMQSMKWINISRGILDPVEFFAAACLCSNVFASSFLASFLAGALWALFLAIAQGYSTSALSYILGNSGFDGIADWAFAHFACLIIFGLAFSVCILVSSFAAFRRSEQGLAQRAWAGLGSCLIMILGTQCLFWLSCYLGNFPRR